MTVAELIAELQKCPPGAEVVLYIDYRETDDLTSVAVVADDVVELR